MDVENLRAGRILEDKLAALRNELERLRLRGVDVAPLRKAINEYRKAQSIVDALGRNEKYSIALRMELEKLGSSQAE